MIDMTAWRMPLHTKLIWIVFLMNAGCGSGDREPLQAQSAVQAPETEFVAVPDVKMKDLEGNIQKLDRYHGEVVLVDFWATWVGPCKVSIPDLIDLYSMYKDKGLVIVGVAINSGSPEDIKSFVAAQRINYPVVLGDRSIEEAFGGVMVPPRDRVASLPTTFLIDREGRLVKHYIGYRANISRREIEADIKAHL